MELTDSPDERNDVWAAGDLYERYVGRWSRLVAREFVSWLSVPACRDWLDVGCGSGALSQLIAETATPRSVRGIDPSASFVEYATELNTSPLVSFEAGDARSIPLADSSVDAAVSGLVLNFVPEPRAAVDEMTRAVRPGGIVAAYVWDYAEKMELMRYFWDAAVSIDPAAESLDEARRFSICEPEALRKLFAQAELREIQSRTIDVPTRFRDFDDYWSPFLGGQGPAPGYAMSLDEQRRDRLRDRIRSALPVSADGTIDLVARAFAVKGVVDDAPSR